jgi:Domain of unknown function (DUF4145)
MAKLTSEGAFLARCTRCDGALTTFEWDTRKPAAPGVRVVPAGGDPPTGFGQVTKMIEEPGGKWHNIAFVLCRCNGCGSGALAAVRIRELVNAAYPAGAEKVLWFYPEAGERLPLPEKVPDGIKKEFREAESCIEATCPRAAAGMLRSVLDKTMRANGYQGVGNLEKQIDAAAADGVITETRRKRAHEDIRVLGNDVLHDEWHEIPMDDVQQAHHYAQRILEDLYDDRQTILGILRSKKRQPDEDRK